MDIPFPYLFFYVVPYIKTTSFLYFNSIIPKLRNNVERNTMLAIISQAGDCSLPGKLKCGRSNTDHTFSYVTLACTFGRNPGEIYD